MWWNILKDLFWQHLYLFGDHLFGMISPTFTACSNSKIRILPILCLIQRYSYVEFSHVTRRNRFLDRSRARPPHGGHCRGFGESARSVVRRERWRKRKKKSVLITEVSLTPVRRWSTSIVSPPLYIRPLPPSYSVAASRWHSCPPFLLAVCKRVLRWRNAGYSTWLASDEMPMATILLCETFLRLVYPPWNETRSHFFFLSLFPFEGSMCSRSDVKYR